MKTILTILVLLIAYTTQAQHTLEKIWESDSTLAIPESVLFDKDGMYISLIDGQPWDADGKGGIARMDKNGKVTNATFTTGLQAPKGLGLVRGKLYVADISDVVVIDATSGKIESKIHIEGATGLNDITIDDKGAVYVSDSQLGRVHKITNGKAQLYLPDTKGSNGLKAVGSELYVLMSTGVYKAGADKKLVLVAPMEIGGDGIEPVGNGEYVLSCWPGLMFYMSKDGKLQQLLDTRAEKKNTADIGYNAAERIVYVPTFAKKSVVAYKLK